MGWRALVDRHSMGVWNSGRVVGSAGGICEVPMWRKGEKSTRVCRRYLEWAAGGKRRLGEPVKSANCTVMSTATHTHILANWDSLVLDD